MTDTGPAFIPSAGIWGRKDTPGRGWGLCQQVGLWEPSEHSAEGTPSAIRDAVLTRCMSPSTTGTGYRYPLA